MRIGIVGYGNIGKAVEQLASQTNNIEIVGIFSRRKIKANSPVYPISDAPKFKGKIDIMLLCGGSEKDLVTQTPYFAKYFNTIDTFDTHQKAPKHYESINRICQTCQTSSIVCCGWDPGLFSCMRVLLGAFFDNVTCFYGKGVSLGHTNALKKIKGVCDAKQYTIPIKKAVRIALKNQPVSGFKHMRKCYVVTNEKHKDIKQKILSIQNYFKGEKVKIKFVKQATLDKKYATLSHKGQIIAESENASLNLNVKMQSNPLFTAKIMLAYTIALEKIYNAKVYKAFTPLQIPVSWLTGYPTSQAIKEFC